MYFVMKLSKLCNLRCTYCYEYEELGQKARMPLDGLAFFFKGIAAHYTRRAWKVPLHFVLHGGEPALLPLDYIRAFAALQREHLGAHGIPYSTSLQSNLTRVNRAWLETLADNDISLGASIDVFGGQRLNLAGKDSLNVVMDNLQTVFDLDLVQRLSVGAITVLHAGNLGDAVSSFHFFNELGLSYRILPIFSLSEPESRMKHLTLQAHEVVDALKKVARAHAKSGSNIQIHPLQEYLMAAVRYLCGHPTEPYDPATMEWALIVNTNGDAYNHSEAYTRAGWMGNIFQDSLSDILDSGGRRRTLQIRAERARTCLACAYGNSCSRIPVIEALPSERNYDTHGELQCLVVRPMIEFLIDEIRSDSGALAAVTQRMRKAG